MKDKFISAWCDEHNFSDKLGAVISKLELREEDLNEDNFDEYASDITVDGDTYTVYDQNDIDDLIREQEEFNKSEIISKYHCGEIEEFIDWNEYFEKNPVEIEDVIGDEFEDFIFYGAVYYIHKED